MLLFLFFITFYRCCAPANMNPLDCIQNHKTLLTFDWIFHELNVDIISHFWGFILLDRIKVRVFFWKEIRSNDSAFHMIATAQHCHSQMYTLYKLRWRNILPTFQTSKPSGMTFYSILSFLPVTKQKLEEIWCVFYVYSLRTKPHTLDKCIHVSRFLFCFWHIYV